MSVTFEVETWLPGADCASSTSGAFARLSGALREVASRLDTIAVVGTGVTLSSSAGFGILSLELREDGWVDVS